MEMNRYHILSLEASAIYKQMKTNGEYVLPKKKDATYFWQFKNILDPSLDVIELEKAHEKARRKFFFEDEYGDRYTLALINLKFNYTYKENLLEGIVGVKELREYFYEHGFDLNGVHYVRYKRSSGSARQGKCLFIDERMLEHMEKWGECGLKPEGGPKDLASWEAYKALSLSSLKDLVKIPFEGILFMPDCKSTFDEEVVCIQEEDGKLVSEKKVSTVTNDIWDGESLLDESIFVDNLAGKHMLLLRNKFFKSCAFKTRLQKWFQDKNITLDDLKARGFVTLAEDISQIVMVTTPNSMKFLKFMKGGLTKTNVQKWMKKTDNQFGIVKYDKRTKFFGGKMVQTSYQFINTLGMNEEQAKTLMKPSESYIKTLYRDYDFMRYHFSDAYKREMSGEKEEIPDGLAERSNVIFKLMNVNYSFKDTKLYYNFRNDVVENQKNRLKEGHILLSGTNATLFGNGPEMLLALSGEFDVKNPEKQSVALGFGEVACGRFPHGKGLVCARSPHITMGNLYCVKNNLSSPLWEYFDLGDNIICVNAIGENIQQRLNGCDYDSDSMLVTDDGFIVDIANKYKDAFAVPVCDIKAASKENQTLAELDYATSENLIGQIVNLSQMLNSFLWDKINDGEIDDEARDEIYRDICILAVLSGIEIDKAKRAYENVNVGAELRALMKRHDVCRPEFFKVFDDKEIANKNKKIKKMQKREKAKKDASAEVEAEETVLLDAMVEGKEKDASEETTKLWKNERDYRFYKTAMEYASAFAKKIDNRAGKEKFVTYISIIDMLEEPACDDAVYKQRDKVIRCCERYKHDLASLYMNLRSAEDDEKESIYVDIQQLKANRKEEVSALLTNERVLYMVLKSYEKSRNNFENWHLYAPILESELFTKMLKINKVKMPFIVETEDGETEIYGRKYTKKL